MTKKKTINIIGILLLVLTFTACADGKKVLDMKSVNDVQTEKVTDTVNDKTKSPAFASDITISEIPIAKEPVVEMPHAETPLSNVDVDLTILSSTMIYSEVYNMMAYPENYIGKTVKMEGTFAVFEDSETGALYYGCIISDATACCSQGMEFTLAGSPVYPDDYPSIGTTITVTGTFETFIDGEYEYCRLADSTLE